MTHTYTVATNGQTITMTLYQGKRFIAVIQGDPAKAINSLISTAALWQYKHQATGSFIGSSAMWDALDPLYRHARDQVLQPLAMTA